MSNSASSTDVGPSSETTPRAAKARKRRSAEPAKAKPGAITHGSPSAQHADSALQLQAAQYKPLLIGVGIGAALVGTAVAMRSKSDKGSSLSPFHGPNSALASAITKTALFAVARVMSGQTVRAVATRALLEVAEAWKA